MSPRPSSIPPKNERLDREAAPKPARRRPVVFAKLGKAGPVDGVLVVTWLSLLAFGVVMVYSASAVYAERTFGNGFHFLTRQAVFAALGISIVGVLATIDYRRLQVFTYPVLFTVFFLLLAVILGVGRSAGGATRWIQVGSFHVQPAEMAKLAIVLWLAYSLSRKEEKIRTFSVGFLPHVLVAGAFMALSLKQPDFGSAVMIGVLTAVMLFAAGTRIGYLLAAAAVVLPLVVAVVASSPYRMKRILGFLDPEGRRFGEGYQLFESLVGFGSGGVTGVGLGDGRQKLFFLPEAHNDFIGAIIGEELGLVGVSLVVLAFVVIVARGMRAAFRAPDAYGAYLAIGVTVLLAAQAFTNLAVGMGLVPTKGLVLPFISYGGSSLLVNCAAMGLLLNVSRPRAAGGSVVSGGAAETGPRVVQVGGIA
jgi:cell division protein FtsW